MRDSRGHALSVARSKPYLVASYTRRWRRLHNAGIPASVIADTPLTFFDIGRCVAADRHHLRRCARDKSRFRWNGGEALARAARQTTFAHYVDLNALVCPWRRCPAVLANILVWRDSDHITARYSYTAK